MTPMWALRHPEDAGHVPITKGWTEARAVVALWAFALAIAVAHVLPTEVMAVLGVATVHGGLLVAALLWGGGVGRLEASAVVGLLAAARALVALHPLGAIAYLMVPLWLARLAAQGRLLRLGLAPSIPWGPVCIGALAGGALALHLITSASRTLGYAVHFQPAVFFPALGYDLGANVLSAELFFRGTLLQHLWRRWSFGLALAAASAAATVRYCVDPFVGTIELRVGAAVYMTLLAILNGALYRWSGSLLPGLAAASIFFACYRLLAIG
jgi:CAAX prenyl protease-like protein